MADIVPPPLHEALARPSWADDFWAHVQPPVETDCWLWRKRDDHGYGTFHRSTWGTKRAHRIAYMWAHGPIPYGRVIDHLCRVTSCVNVAHLEAVTEQVNILRGIGPAAQNARSESCSAGHPFVPATTTGWDLPTQSRICLICHYDRARRAHYRQPTHSPNAGPCPECGRILHVKRDGTMHKHYQSPNTPCPGSSRRSVAVSA